MAMLETSGFFGPVDIPVPLLAVAARNIRPVKHVGPSLWGAAEAGLDRLRLGGKNLDDCEDQGTLEDAQLAVSKLVALGLAYQDDNTGVVIFHRLIQEYARARPTHKQCAAAVMDALSGAFCGVGTTDHFVAMWRRRKWLEQEGYPMPLILDVGLKLAEHWSNLDLASKVMGICDEALARSRGLGDTRFRFWQLKYSAIVDSKGGANAGSMLDEMHKCNRAMHKDMVGTPIWLLVQVEILYRSVVEGTYSVQEARGAAEQLEEQVRELATQVPSRDITGPFGEFVVGNEGSLLSFALQTLSLLYFMHDAMVYEGVALLRESRTLYDRTSEEREELRYTLSRNLCAGFSALLRLSDQQQIFHDAFRSVVVKGLPTGLVRVRDGDWRLVKGGRLEKEGVEGGGPEQIFEVQLQEEEEKVAEELQRAIECAWPRGNSVMGDVHFEEEQREAACDSLVQMLGSLKDPHSLEGAPTRAKLALIRRGDAAMLEESRVGLEQALLEDLLVEKSRGSTCVRSHALVVLTSVYDKVGKMEECEIRLREGLKLSISDEKTRPRKQFLLALTLIKRGKTREAGRLLEEVLGRFRMEGQKRSGAAAACFAFLGVVEWLEGHPTAAQGYVQNAVEVLSTELGPNHMRVADLLAAIGYMQALRLTELDGALANFRKVLHIHSTHFPPGDPALAYTLSDIVFTLEQQEKDWARDDINRNKVAFWGCRTREERAELGEKLQLRAVDLMEKRRGLREEISRKKMQALDICASREDLIELSIIKRRLKRLNF